MNALIITAKFLILVGCITVLPIGLTIYTDLSPLYVVGGSLVLTVILSIAWMVPGEAAAPHTPAKRSAYALPRKGDRS